MEKVEYIKDGKGYSILVNGQWKVWIIGSIRVAKEYYNKYIKTKVDEKIKKKIHHN